MLTDAGWPTRFVVDWLLMVLHDKVWRKVSVLRRRKRIGSLLMRSSGQTGGVWRFVPRRWRQRRPGDNRGSHDGGTVTDGLAISMRLCVFLCLRCALLHRWICHGYSSPTASLWLDSGALLAIGDAAAWRCLAIRTGTYTGSLLYLVATGILLVPPRGWRGNMRGASGARAWQSSDCQILIDEALTYVGRPAWCFFNGLLSIVARWVVIRPAGGREADYCVTLRRRAHDRMPSRFSEPLARVPYHLILTRWQLGDVSDADKEEIDDLASLWVWELAALSTTNMAAAVNRYGGSTF